MQRGGGATSCRALDVSMEDQWFAGPWVALNPRPSTLNPKVHPSPLTPKVHPKPFAKPWLAALWQVLEAAWQDVCAAMPKDLEKASLDLLRDQVGGLRTKWGLISWALRKP